MTRTHELRRGVVLLDVILGVTILVIAGVGFVTMLSQNFFTVEQMREREREITGASQQLERMAALWSVRDFESRLGTWPSGAFATTINRVAMNLYAVEIADSTGARLLLRTTMYATDTTNAR